MRGSGADILLIGAGGPIGRALERLLHTAGKTVVSTTRTSGTRPLDVDDRVRVREVLSALRPRTVVYLVNPHLPASATTSDVDAAIAATAHTAAEAAAAGAGRFVFASSGAVYGDMRREPLQEDAPLDGAGAYAALKIGSESAIYEVTDPAMSVISARIFNVYGPGCDMSLINRLRDGPMPNMYRTASFVRDYVEVGDVASALQAAILTERDDIGAVNIGTGRAVDNLMLMSAVPPDRYRAADAPNLHSFSVADPSYAASALGWRARTDVLDALRR